MTINWSRLLWDGLPENERAAVRSGQYDDRFPNLKKTCLPAIADDAFADALAELILVDASRTDS